MPKFGAAIFLLIASRPDIAGASFVGTTIFARPTLNRGPLVPFALSRNVPGVDVFYRESTKRKHSLPGSVRRATNSDNAADEDGGSSDKQRKNLSARVREKVSTAGRSVRRIVSPLTSGGPSIAGVLKDAAVGAADIAAEEVRAAARNVVQARNARGLDNQAQIEGDTQAAIDAISLAKTTVADAFYAAESALDAAEDELKRARTELDISKRDAALGLAAAERAAADAANKARLATESATLAVTSTLISNESATSAVTPTLESDAAVVQSAVDAIEAPSQEASEATGAQISKDDGTDSSSIDSEKDGDLWNNFDASSLRYEDVDYALSEMLPPFINEDECLVPGEPIVRVEKAPQNSRRIFAGIDIPVDVEDVWKLLTDYENLQKVVPNLVVNEVINFYEGCNGDVSTFSSDSSLEDEDQCKAMAEEMKGVVLKQVGGAKVVGINFSARTTLEVREWPMGMPDFANFEDEMYEGKSRSARARENKGRELKRYIFPRPFALSSLPHKDISMQSIEEDDGEFRMYQGVWRMQPLVGCAPPGSSAMRLTYAVEVSPRPYLPVAFVEGRIAQDLCNNLKAIRDVFTSK